MTEIEKSGIIGNTKLDIEEKESNPTISNSLSQMLVLFDLDGVVLVENDKFRKDVKSLIKYLKSRDDVTLGIFTARQEKYVPKKVKKLADWKVILSEYHVTFTSNFCFKKNLNQAWKRLPQFNINNTLFLDDSLEVILPEQKHCHLYIPHDIFQHHLYEDNIMNNIMDLFKINTTCAQISKAWSTLFFYHYTKKFLDDDNPNEGGNVLNIWNDYL